MTAYLDQLKEEGLAPFFALLDKSVSGEPNRLRQLATIFRWHAGLSPERVAVNGGSAKPPSGQQDNGPQHWRKVLTKRDEKLKQFVQQKKDALNKWPIAPQQRLGLAGQLGIPTGLVENPEAGNAVREWQRASDVFELRKSLNANLHADAEMEEFRHVLEEMSERCPEVYSDIFTDATNISETHTLGLHVLQDQASLNWFVRYLGAAWKGAQVAKVKAEECETGMNFFTTLFLAIQNEPQGDISRYLEDTHVLEVLVAAVDAAKREWDSLQGAPEIKHPGTAFGWLSFVMAACESGNNNEIHVGMTSLFDWAYRHADEYGRSRKSNSGLDRALDKCTQHHMVLGAAIPAVSECADWIWSGRVDSKPTQSIWCVALVSKMAVVAKFKGWECSPKDSFQGDMNEYFTHVAARLLIGGTLENTAIGKHLEAALRGFVPAEYSIRGSSLRNSSASLLDRTKASRRFGEAFEDALDAELAQLNASDEARRLARLVFLVPCTKPSQDWFIDGYEKDKVESVLRWLAKLNHKFRSELYEPMMRANGWRHPLNIADGKGVFMNPKYLDLEVLRLQPDR